MSLNHLLVLSVLLVFKECYQISAGDCCTHPTLSNIIPHSPSELLENNFSKVNYDRNNNNNTTLAVVRRNTSERILKRGRRYLDFEKGSRMSWRLMLKQNLLKVNTQFAFGYGIRTNYPFPAKEDRYVRPFYKRDLFHLVEDVMDGHGFDGRACILKTFCAVIHSKGVEDNGMLFKLMKMIFSLEHFERRQLPYLKSESCEQLLYSHCPLDLEALSPYTDLDI